METTQSEEFLKINNIRKIGSKVEAEGNDFDNLMYKVWSSGVLEGQMFSSSELPSSVSLERVMRREYRRGLKDGKGSKLSKLLKSLCFIGFGAFCTYEYYKHTKNVENKKSEDSEFNDPE